MALALEGAGWAEFLAGADEQACATFEEFLRLQQAAGNPHLVNRAMVALGQMFVALNRVEEARACAAEILKFSRAHHDTRGEHSAWHYLADCALIEGQCADSVRHYRESLRLANQLGDRVEIGAEVQGIAMSLAGLGAADLALRLAAGIEAEWERIGADIAAVRFWTALLDRYLGSARAAAGGDAARIWSEGRAMTFDETVALALSAAAEAA
jgi:tetratricopeptide (TPR) repeat protein